MKNKFPSGTFKKLEDSISLTQDPRIKEIPLPKNDFNIATELNRWTAKHKKTGEDKSTIVLSEEDDFGTITKGGLEMKISDEEYFYQRAVMHHKKKQYKQAVAEIDKLLEINVNFHPAFFIRASSNFHLGKSTEAILDLAALQDVNLKSNLNLKVIALRDKLRQQQVLEMNKGYLKGDKIKLRDRLEKLIPADKKFDFYYFVLSILQFERGKYKEAYTVLTDGINQVPKDKNQSLLKFKPVVLKKMLSKVLQKPIRLFKEKKYSEARKYLEKIQHDYKSIKEFQLFQEYINNLSGGLLSWLNLKGVKSVKMKGTSAEKNWIYDLISEEEINKTYSFLRRGNFTKAEEQLYVALNNTPFYYLPYEMLAIHKYNHFVMKFITRRMSDLGGEIIALDSAKKHIQKAKELYPEKNYDGLIKNIEFGHSFLTKIKKDTDQVRKDLDFVNLAIGKYNKIMGNSNKGIRDINHLESVYKKMAGLKKEVGKGIKTVNQRHQKTLKDMHTSIDKNLEILTGMRKTFKEQKADEKYVKRSVERFESYMKKMKASDGFKITSLKQLNSVKSTVNDLIDKIKSDRNRVKHPTSKKVIDSVLNQLNILKNQLNNLG